MGSEPISGAGGAGKRLCANCMGAPASVVKPTQGGMWGFCDYLLLLTMEDWAQETSTEETEQKEEKGAGMCGWERGDGGGIV